MQRSCFVLRHRHKEDHALGVRALELFFIYIHVGVRTYLIAVLIEHSPTIQHFQCQSRWLQTRFR
jgi:hypothetical protein